MDLEINEYSNFEKLKYDSIKSYMNTLDEEFLLNEQRIKTLSETLIKDKRSNVKKLGERLTKNFDKYCMEVQRVKKMYDFDYSFGEYNTVAGIDEVGRGPLAGPIVAAAVILKKTAADDELILGLNDSKKLSAEKRERLEKIIMERALAFKISFRDNNQIDNSGIGICNNEIFIESCEGLNVKPELVLTDGYPIRGYHKVKNIHVIKGDTKSAAIAAASIIAKVYRDRLMKEYSKIYPYYGFESNVGYGSKDHIVAIKKYGITTIHRRSFLTGILQK